MKLCNFPDYVSLNIALSQHIYFPHILFSEAPKVCNKVSWVTVHIAAPFVSRSHSRSLPLEVRCQGFRAQILGEKSPSIIYLLYPHQHRPSIVLTSEILCLSPFMLLRSTSTCTNEWPEKDAGWTV